MKKKRIKHLVFILLCFLTFSFSFVLAYDCCDLIDWYQEAWLDDDWEAAQAILDEADRMDC